MPALTRDFHFLTSRLTTNISAILLPVRYIAKAWDVRALFHLLIRHVNPSFLVLFICSICRTPQMLIACSSPNSPRWMSEFFQRFIGITGKASCRECQLTDSGVGIWTMLGSEVSVPCQFNGFSGLEIFPNPDGMICWIICHLLNASSVL